VDLKCPDSLAIPRKACAVAGLGYPSSRGSNPVGDTEGRGRKSLETAASGLGVFRVRKGCSSPASGQATSAQQLALANPCPQQGMRQERWCASSCEPHRSTKALCNVRPEAKQKYASRLR
jgi:hypothetical protein